MPDEHTTGDEAEEADEAPAVEETAAADESPAVAEEPAEEAPATDEAPAANGGGQLSPPADERPGGYWARRHRWALVAVVIGTAVLVTAVAVAWQPHSPEDAEIPTWRLDQARTAEQTVDAFFNAQADGDCELLTDLLTEESWSDGGHLSRGQFLDRCADAVEGYEPNVGDNTYLEVFDEHGNPLTRYDPVPDVASASVTFSPGDGNVVDDGWALSAESPEGRLVREDGVWKVETDGLVFHIGRSVEETIGAYVDAYNAGDCGGVVDILADDVWSHGGELTRDEFLRACEQAATRRRALGQSEVNVRAVEVSIDDDGHAVVTLEGGAAEMFAPDDEAATFVRDGFKWKVEGDEQRAALAPWAPFLSVHLAEVAIERVDDVSRNDQPCFQEWGDIGEVVESAAGPPGVLFYDTECDVRLTLYRLGDADQARAYAQQRATEIVQDPPLTAEELVDIPYSYTPEEAARQAAEYRPNEPAAVPGMPDAYGARRWCTDRCWFGVAVASAGNVVVEIEDRRTADDLTYAASVLQQQLGVITSVP